MPERDGPNLQQLSPPPGMSIAETHAHTLASDGVVTAEALVRAAARIGLSVLCITDHDVIGDLDAATALGQELGVDIVRGEEITTHMPPALHIVGIFLERPVRMGMSVKDTIDAIHDQGALAIIAHPFMPTYFASMSERQALRLLETHRVDGIEVRHTAPVFRWAWPRLDAFYAAHQERLGAALGASDSHFGVHDLGRRVTTFPGRGAADLRKAIEHGLTAPRRGLTPMPPSWKQRLLQQKRSLIELNLDRIRRRT